MSLRPSVSLLQPFVSLILGLFPWPFESVPILNTREVVGSGFSVEGAYLKRRLAFVAREEEANAYAKLFWPSWPRFRNIGGQERSLEIRSHKRGRALLLM
jgi:hypothetical protein